MSRIVIGISGASGIVLAHKVIEALTSLGHYVEFIMTHDAAFTAFEEMGEVFAGPLKFTQTFSKEQQTLIRSHGIHDFAAPLASGTFSFDAMAVVPCSMASLAAISCGISDNLLRRVADVTLKEKRRLVLVPREAPFNEIHLENMLRLARMGAFIIPPQPAWYTKPQTIEDIERHIVGRILDFLGITGYSYPRWEGKKKEV